MRIQVEHGLEALLGESGVTRFPPIHQQLEPRRAPLQLAHDRQQLRLGARREVQGHDAVDLPLSLNGIGDVVALARGLPVLPWHLAEDDLPSPLGQGPLGGLGEVGHATGALGPEGRG